WVSELQEQQGQSWPALDRRNTGGIRQTAGGSLALPSALKDLSLVGESSSEVPLQSANRRSVANVDQCVWE
ncbi:hypothetical protein HAX54_036153, partial [Datura stramonium]|nr:hypothetical protein [Datura stramonium]